MSSETVTEFTNDVPTGVVVGVDGSASARAAAQWAAYEARRRGMPLIVAAAYVIPQFLYAEGMFPSERIVAELQDQAQEAIDDAVAAVQELDLDIEEDLQVEQYISEGSPVKMLLDLSRQAPMVVLGSRGLGGVTGAIMGSVSASVVRHAECPVVVIRHDMHVSLGLPQYPDGPIVVGADGSEVSQLALAEAFAMADAQEVPLVVANAWLDRGAQSTIAVLNLTVEEWQATQARQAAQVETLIAPFVEKYPQVKYSISVRQDSPEAALSRAAKKARLLVVGSHGRGGFSGMLLGSTSRALLRLSPCPVMVVRESH